MNRHGGTLSQIVLQYRYQSRGFCPLCLCVRHFLQVSKKKKKSRFSTIVEPKIPISGLTPHIPPEHDRHERTTLIACRTHVMRRPFLVPKQKKIVVSFSHENSVNGPFPSFPSVSLTKRVKVRNFCYGISYLFIRLSAQPRISAHLE